MAVASSVEREMHLCGICAVAVVNSLSQFLSFENRIWMQSTDAGYSWLFRIGRGALVLGLRNLTDTVLRYKIKIALTVPH
jgi:hypothetical protein